MNWNGILENIYLIQKKTSNGLERNKGGIRHTKKGIGKF